MNKDKGDAEGQQKMLFLFVDGFLSINLYFFSNKKKFDEKSKVVA